MKFYYLLLVALIVPFSLFSQDEEEEWQPQTHVTGYINTIAEYNTVDSWREANKDVGIGLSEVGFLASYKPLEKLELKSTLVYSHLTANIQAMVVETYAKYGFNKSLNVSAGKFLAPLSPINTYFYAPLNPSGVLPMLVGHFYIYPQSISGFQVSGMAGDDMKVEYNVTYGNYTTKGHMSSGITSMIGYEDLIDFPGAPGKTNEEQNYDLGGSGRVAFKYGDLASIGANMFTGTRATLAAVDYSTGEQVVTYPTSQKNSFGVDAHLNVNDQFKLNAEYWTGYNETNELVDLGAADEVKLEYDGYYVELIYNTGKFTPFARYEQLSDGKGVIALAGLTGPIMVANASVSSIGGGIAYRPIYEVLLKFDYRLLNTEMDDGAKAIGMEEDSYSHIMLSTVFSF